MLSDIHYIRVVKVPEQGFDHLKERLGGLVGDFYIDVDDDSAYAEVVGDDCNVEELDTALEDAEIEVVVAMTFTAKDDDAWTAAHSWTTFQGTYD